MMTVTAAQTSIDHWVRESLGERYKSVLREELPREWLLLVEKVSKD
jgi:hypothetical protein